MRQSLAVSGRFSLLIFLLLVSSFWRPAHAEETLSLPLDGTISPEQTLADISATGLLVYRTGHKGKALRVGGLYGALKVPVEGLLSAGEGSVAMWVSPLDWSAKDKDFHVFFDARGDGALVLYKYFEDSRLLFLATRDINSDGNIVVGQSLDWSPGTWKHLVATWSYQGIRLYLDGSPVANIPTPADLPKTLMSTIDLGDSAWGRPRVSSSLLDEVRLFNHALTPAQVARLYRGQTGDSMYVPFGANALTVTHDATNANGLQLTLEWSHAVATNAVSYTVDVLCADGRVGQRLTGTATAALQQVSLPLPGCRTEGPLRIVVRASDSIGKDIENSLMIEGVHPVVNTGVIQGRRPVSPPALGIRTSGDEPKQEVQIPSPWTAPVVAQNGIHVWGRHFSFAEGPLASAISSQNRAVVPSPIQLLYGGTPLAGVSGSFSLQGSHAGEVLLPATTLALEQSGISFAGAVAYDGLYHLRMRAAEAITLQRNLQVRIPLSPDLLQRWHKYTGRALGNTGALAQSKGTLLKSAYAPYLWLGNDLAGLFWYAESDRFWPNASRSDAIRVERTANGAQLMLNLASAGAQLPKGWQFEFGLMPTPVRPVVAGKGSRLRLAPLSRPDIDVVWPENSDRSFKLYGYPEARVADLFDADLRRREQAGTKVAPYLCPTFLSTGSPEWRAYGAQWSLKRFDSTSTDVMAMGGALALMSPRASSWQQFFTGKLEQFIARHHPGALYFDNAQLYGGAVPDVGVGYLSGKTSKTEYPLLAYRRLFHSLARVGDEGGATTRILHGSGQLNPMIASSGTYFLNGEQYRGVVQDSYLKILSLDEFRQQFSSQVTGAAPLFIPEFDAARQALVQPTHELMGLLLVHDVPLWPVWVNVSVVEKSLQALEGSVPAGGQFVRYDSARVPATVANSAVLLSAHVATGASPLLVAFNTGVKTTTDVCMKSAGDARATALTDRLSATTYKRTTARCYRVDFPARGFRLLKAAGAMPRQAQ